MLEEEKRPSPAWRLAVIRVLRFFSWLTLFFTLFVSLGVAWLFGTVAVATADGIHREINPMGVAAAIGILFFGVLIVLFLLVVCACVEALVELCYQLRNASGRTVKESLGKRSISSSSHDSAKQVRDQPDSVPDTLLSDVRSNTS